MANEIPGAFKDAQEHRRWCDATEGPYFANWMAPGVLSALNARLRRAGETTPLREIPIRPSGDAPMGGYVAMWPVGVPHGSSANRTRRVTITLPIGTTGRPLSQTARSVERTKALATIAASDTDLTGTFYEGTPAEQRRRAEAFLARDTVPLADGATHRRPEYAAEYVRHPDAPGTTGPYYRLAPSVAQVRAFFA